MLAHRLVFLGAAGLMFTAAQPARAQSVIRACANPAGQLRVVGAAESCRPQETLITWNSAGAPGPAGPSGPMGPAGPPGSDAEGVTGGADHSPFGNSSPAILSATPTPLTTDNIVTGFRGYMVWANVALQFNTGNPATGSVPSPSSAGCSITYTVDGRMGSFVVDGRSVSYPMNTVGQNDRLLQFSLGLNGLVGEELSPPLDPAETVNVSLMCNAPGPTPPVGQPVPVPVKVTNWSLSGIGVTKPFQ